MAESGKRFSRRMVALFWCFLVIITLGVLIYLEQIALLYVLTSVALIALLLAVGFADLEKADRENVEGLTEIGGIK